MNRKQWVLFTVALAIVHGFLAYLLTPISGDIVFSRFDGNDYASAWDPILVGLYFLLLFPYFIFEYFLPPIQFLPPVPAHYIAWIGNSLIWGLMGAWLISKLPFMKDQNLSEKTTRHPDKTRDSI